MSRKAVPLTQRIRPGSEAAPWVCLEIKRLEAENKRLKLALQNNLHEALYQKQVKALQAKVEQLEVKAQDKEILRAFFEAVCDDNWEVANGIREALTGGAQALGGNDE